jgi:hypothetical protein
MAMAAGPPSPYCPALDSNQTTDGQTRALSTPPLATARRGSPTGARARQKTRRRGSLTTTKRGGAFSRGERRQRWERGGEMVGWMKALVYGVGGVAVVGLAALVALQERLVYVPVLPGLARAYSITPTRLGLIYDDVWLRAADGVRLHSWFIYHSPAYRG